MWRTWRAALGAWDDFRAEPYDFIEAGQHVVVLNHIDARGKGSGAEVSADTATVWTMDVGKVVRLALYWDIATALEAAGLPEKPMSQANEELVRETARATVLVVADHVARGLKSGLELREETASAFRVHDGEITRVELYRTREEALEAVELPE